MAFWRWTVLFPASLVFGTWVTGLCAQSPPAIITIVVPYAAGAGSDRLGRLTAAALEKMLGQPVAVSNIVGDGGVAGMDFVAEAPPNGTTIGLALSTPIVAATLLRRQRAYDVFKDFDWLTIIGTYGNAMVTLATGPANFSAWLSSAQSSQVPLRYGSAGVGSAGHFAGEYLHLEQGANIVHVPFATMTEAYAALAAGQLSVLFDGVPNASQATTANKTSLLAVTTESRLRNLPAVPAFGEIFPKQSFLVWAGLVAPPGMPAASRERLTKAIVALYADQGFLAQLRDLGIEVVGVHDRQAFLYVENDFIRQARMIAKIRTAAPN